MKNDSDPFLAKKLLIAGTTLAALGAAGCTVADANPEEGERNPDIISVSLDEGANVRETPSKNDMDDGLGDNLLTQLSDSVTFSPEDGVRTHNDKNGTWYGVSVKDLSGEVDAETAKALKEDPDGMVWINDDRATPQSRQ